MLSAGASCHSGYRLARLVDASIPLSTNDCWETLTRQAGAPTAMAHELSLGSNGVHLPSRSTLAPTTAPSSRTALS